MTRRDAGRSLDSFLRPKSVAIVGASGREGSPFARPLNFLVEHGFAGDIYPVNPNYDSLAGLPCYPSLAAIPGPAELVLMLVSATEVAPQLELAAAAGARAAIVFASGFREAGPDGARLQQELAEHARRLDLRILGPNCQGVVSAYDRMAATFSAGVEEALPVAGNIAYAGQSGAVGGSILSLARARGLGIGFWASTGNEVDVTSLELGQSLIEDERVEVLALYLESAADGHRFVPLAARARELGVAVAILRSGRSQAGARAAASHTGAIIGSDAAFKAVCHDYGVVECDDISDFIGVVHALSALPRARGRRLAVVTTSGGAGSLLADQAENLGLEVRPLGEATRTQLSKLVPSFGSVDNPVDVTAQLFRTNDMTDFFTVVSSTLDDPDVDSLALVTTLVTGELADNVAKGTVELSRSGRKPIACIWLVSHEQTTSARALLREAGLPVFDSPRAAIQALAALSRPSSSPPRDAAPMERARAAAHLLDRLPSGAITEAAGADLLKSLGIATPAQRLVTNASDATSAASSLATPLVLKVQSATILHKTELGGVVLGVALDDVAATFTAIADRFALDQIDGVLIQEQAPEGLDLVLGITNVDPGYPPLVTVGFGGIFAEVLGDVSTRSAPVNHATATEMLRGLRGHPLLSGARGADPFDVDAAAEAVVALSELATVAPQIIEAEINPLRLLPSGGVVALDLLLRQERVPKPPQSALTHHASDDGGPQTEENS